MHIWLMESLQKHINTLNTDTFLFYFNLQCLVRCFFLELPAESQLFCHISPTHHKVSSKLNWNTCSIQQHLWSKYTLWTLHISWKWICHMSDIRWGKATRRGEREGKQEEKRCSSYLISDFKPFQQGDKLLLDVGLLWRKKERKSTWDAHISISVTNGMYSAEGNDRSKMLHFWWLKSSTLM